MIFNYGEMAFVKILNVPIRDYDFDAPHAMMVAINYQGRVLSYKKLPYVINRMYRVEVVYEPVNISPMTNYYIDTFKPEAVNSNTLIAEVDGAIFKLLPLESKTKKKVYAVRVSATLNIDNTYTAYEFKTPMHSVLFMRERNINFVDVVPLYTAKEKEKLMEFKFRTTRIDHTVLALLRTNQMISMINDIKHVKTLPTKVEHDVAYVVPFSSLKVTSGIILICEYRVPNEVIYISSPSTTISNATLSLIKKFLDDDEINFCNWVKLTS